jgi:hypothetical protein
MVRAFEGIGHDLVMPLKGCRGIAIEGGSDFIGDVCEVNVFGMQRACLVGEVVHGLLRLREVGRRWIATAAAGAQGCCDASEQEKCDDKFHVAFPISKF